ncbi:MAG: SDR family oxidoreductase [Phycisphaerae bacterium]|nr:SDR family oxidoreductase [Phycisphaerae bacterium]
MPELNVTNPAPDALAKRVALVTGAGSGIGRAIALALGVEGYALAFVGRTRAKLDETAILVHSSDAIVLTGDVANAEFAASCVDACVARFGRIDLLVNAAGVAPLAKIEATNEATLTATFGANTFGPAYLIARAWPIFRSQRIGCVVNVSSIGTTDPFPGFFAYAASKSALDSLTRSIAREGKSIGVTAYCVNPGAVETPLLRQNFSERVLPTSRTLAPEAVAAIAVDCAVGRRPGDNGCAIAMVSP